MRALESATAYGRASGHSTARRALGPEPGPAPPLSRTALLFLRGRDADARIAELVAERQTLRPALGLLAARFVKARHFEPLGFRSLGDFGRERLGVTAHALRAWARVADALATLPRLREAVASGEVSWSVARRAVAHAAPETDAAFAAALRGRTVRAADEMLRAAFGEAHARQAAEREAGHERVRVSVPLPAAEHPRWLAAIELARAVAGEPLPVWECAEAIAAEALAALPPACVAAAAGTAAAGAGPRSEQGQEPDARAGQGRQGRPAAGSSAQASRASCAGPSSREHGLRHEAFPLLRWRRRAAPDRRSLDRLAA